jgi:hypothetical protein
MKKLLLFTIFALSFYDNLSAQFVSPWTNDGFGEWYNRTGAVWRSGSICLFDMSNDGIINNGLLFSSANEWLNPGKWSTQPYGLTVGNRAQLRLSRYTWGSWRGNPIVLNGSKGLALGTDNASMMLHENGIVSIGMNSTSWNSTINQLSDKDNNYGDVASGYMLYVRQGIVTEKLKVSLVASWPDYVFQKDYTLTPLSIVEQHIKEKGYLHKSKSAAEVEKDGIEVAETAKAQQEKIEELFLHLIDMDKRLKAVEIENTKLKADLDNNKK